MHVNAVFERPFERTDSRSLSLSKIVVAQFFLRIRMLHAGDRRTDYPFKILSPFASTEWRGPDENHLLWLFPRICCLCLSSSRERNSEGRVSFEEGTNALVIVRPLFPFFGWKVYS